MGIKAEVQKIGAAARIAVKFQPTIKVSEYLIPEQVTAQIKDFWGPKIPILKAAGMNVSDLENMPPCLYSAQELRRHKQADPPLAVCYLPSAFAVPSREATAALLQLWPDLGDDALKMHEILAQETTGRAGGGWFDFECIPNAPYRDDDERELLHRLATLRRQGMNLYEFIIASCAAHEIHGFHLTQDFTLARLLGCRMNRDDGQHQPDHNPVLVDIERGRLHIGHYGVLPNEASFKMGTYTIGRPRQH